MSARLPLAVSAAAGAAAVAVLAHAASAAAEPAVQEEEPLIKLDMSKFPLDHHLLHSGMAGDDRLEKYELHLQATPGGTGKAVVAHARLGSKACGHPHIVHGGALASLLDDAFGVAFFTAKLGSGFTANLSVDYRRPLAAGTDIVVKAAIERVEVSASSGAKKVFLVGSVCDAASPATVYTEARALFIVKAVNSALVEATVKAMDEAHNEQQQHSHAHQNQPHQPQRQHHQSPAAATGAASSSGAVPAATERLQ